MILDTDTPGYSVVIYARRTQPNPDTFDTGPTGWVQVGGAAAVRTQRQTIRADTGGVRYRYYLVWITSLGSHKPVAINEIALYT